MEVISALTGEEVITIPTSGIDGVHDLYKAVHHLLGNTFHVMLLDDERDIREIPVSEVKGPLLLVRGLACREAPGGSFP